jgi:hypothetical protein
MDKNEKCSRQIGGADEDMAKSLVSGIVILLFILFVEAVSLTTEVLSATKADLYDRQTTIEYITTCVVTIDQDRHLR